MAKSSGTHVEPLAVPAGRRGWLLPPARYRHPGDMIRLIIAGLVLGGALAVTFTTNAMYAGATASAVTALRPSTLPGRVLGGLVQGAFVLAAIIAVVVTLRHRRFRLLIGLACGALATGALLAGIILLAGGKRPSALAAGPWWWLTGAPLLSAVFGAAAAAGTVIAAPWLSRPWRRTAWITLWLAAALRLITGTASPMEVILTFAAGVTIGAGVLVLGGVPDQRIGPEGVAAALGAAGLPVKHVDPAAVEAKGSRPFTAVAEDGRPLFLKVLGSD
jgi:glycosyltransferase 2 family protein